MSTDPQGLGETPFSPKNYINIKIKKHHICRYKGECKVDDVLVNEHNLLCLYCHFRRPLNIPKMLEEKLKEYKKSK